MNKNDIKELSSLVSFIIVSFEKEETKLTHKQIITICKAYRLKGIYLDTETAALLSLISVYGLSINNRLTLLGILDKHLHYQLMLISDMVDLNHHDDF